MPPLGLTQGLAPQRSRLGTGAVGVASLVRDFPGTPQTGAVMASVLPSGYTDHARNCGDILRFWRWCIGRAGCDAGFVYCRCY